MRGLCFEFRNKDRGSLPHIGNKWNYQAFSCHATFECMDTWVVLKIVLRLVDKKLQRKLSLLCADDSRCSKESAMFLRFKTMRRGLL